MALVTLPAKQQLAQLLGNDDFFLWEYYGQGALGRIQAWIFESRVRVIKRILKQMHLRPRMMLDVGCGAMFPAYPLIDGPSCEYVGVDIMPAWRLAKYKNAMKKIGVARIEVIRASAEVLPLKDGFSDFVLSLDMLEHLDKPKRAIIEIHRVTKDRGLVVVSLPLENSFQKFSRLGFVLMSVREIIRISFMRKRKGAPISQRPEYYRVGSQFTRTPDYHYGGTVKSYDGILRILTNAFRPLQTKYTPIGGPKLTNINAVHILQKKIS